MITLRLRRAARIEGGTQDRHHKVQRAGMVVQLSLHLTILLRGVRVPRGGMCGRGGGGAHCGGGIGHGVGHGVTQLRLELALELAEELRQGEELLALREELLAHPRLDRGHGALQL